MYNTEIFMSLSDKTKQLPIKMQVILRIRNTIHPKKERIVLSNDTMTSRN